MYILLLDNLNPEQKIHINQYRNIACRQQSSQKAQL